MALSLYRPNEALAERSTFDLMPQALELATKLAATEFVPVALRNKPAAIMACVLAGHEVGLPPMASLQHVHVIEGRPSLSAGAQRALILAHGHEIWIEEQTTTRAKVCGRRRGEERITEVIWTLDDAKRAGLMGKQNWQRYPRNMLVARATGDVARGAFMDVLGGIAYNTEELQDGAIEGEAFEAAPAEQPDPVRRTRKASRAATAPEASEPPPAPEIEEPEASPVEEQPAAAPDPAPQPEPAETPLAGQRQQGENLTLAQRVAMICAEVGIERSNLIFAVTGKRSGREITREQATEVLEAAKAIQRQEKLLVGREGGWQLLPVTQQEETDDAPPAPDVDPEDWA